MSRVISEQEAREMNNELFWIDRGCSLLFHFIQKFEVFPQNLELLTFYTLSFSEASNTLGVYMLGNTYMAINDQYLSCTNMWFVPLEICYLFSCRELATTGGRSLVEWRPAVPAQWRRWRGTSLAQHHQPATQHQPLPEHPYTYGNWLTPYNYPIKLTTQHFLTNQHKAKQKDPTRFVKPIITSILQS